MKHHKILPDVNISLENPLAVGNIRLCGSSPTEKSLLPVFSTRVQMKVVFCYAGVR